MLAHAVTYLLPPPQFLVGFVLYLGLFIIWPLVQALRAGRYGWALAIVVFPVIGALLWWAVGRAARGSRHPGSPEEPLSRPTLTLAPWEIGYLVAVAGLATWGFFWDSATGLIAAAVLTIPAAFGSFPAFYMLVGFLGLALGGTSTVDTSNTGCARNASATCHVSAPVSDTTSWWLMHVTDAVGVLCLVAGAVVNVALMRSIREGRQAASRSASDRSAA